MYVRSSALRPGSLARICVVLDDIKSTFFRGRIYHPASGKQFSFARVSEFLMLMGGIFDTYGFPQHTHSLRTFRGAKQVKLQKISNDYITGDLTEMEKQFLSKENKGKATFIIKVLFRQNATWQGQIQWVEKKKTQNFRSDLEMLKLMDEALKMTDNGEDDTAKWD